MANAFLAEKDSAVEKDFLSKPSESETTWSLARVSKLRTTAAHGQQLLLGPIVPPFIPCKE